MGTAHLFDRGCILVDTSIMPLVRPPQENRLTNVPRDSADCKILLMWLLLILLRLRNLHDRAVDPFVEQLLPPPSPGKRFDQRAVRPRPCPGRKLAAVGGDDALAAAAAG
jgi:hypothetical protein